MFNIYRMTNFIQSFQFSPSNLQRKDIIELPLTLVENGDN